MTDWSQYADPDSSPAAAGTGEDWSQYPDAQQPPSQKPVFSGSILPFSKYADGSVGFDSDAGIVGAVKHGAEGAYNTIANLPNLYRQVGAETASNTATPETAGQVANLASMTTPGDMMAPGLSGELAPQAVKAGTWRTAPSGALVPSAPELYGAGKGDLNAARGMGVDYSIPHVSDLSDTIEQQLYRQGIGPADAPRTFAKLGEARNVPPDAVSVPIDGLMGIRRGFSKLTADKSASDMDRAAAATALGHFQGFLENPPPEAVLAGPAADAGALVSQGNANYAAAKRSDLVTDRGASAELGASSANSGRNYDNILRQKLKPLVDPTSPQRHQLNSFTAPEKQSVQDIVQGAETPTQNVLRTVGNLGAGGHGVGASMLGVGAGLLGEHVFGPVGSAIGLIPPMAGSVARTVQNSAARNAVEGVGAQLRQRSPLYQDRLKSTPLTVKPNTTGIAAIRAATPTIEGQQDGQQDQPGFAKGGSVKKPSHEYLVTRLMNMVEKAKKAEKERTKPLLKVPDDTVANALAAAQRAI